MKTEIKPSYPVATITAKDGLELKQRYYRLKAIGYDHQDIYRAGLDAIEQNHIKDLHQNNISWLTNENVMV